MKIVQTPELIVMLGRTVITLSGETLFWNENQSGRVEMIPLSETDFALNGGSVVFLRDESGVFSRLQCTTLEAQVEGSRK